jgi:hypothetical protein
MISEVTKHDDNTIYNAPNMTIVLLAVHLLMLNIRKYFLPGYQFFLSFKYLGRGGEVNIMPKNLFLEFRKIHFGRHHLGVKLLKSKKKFTLGCIFKHL